MSVQSWCRCEAKRNRGDHCQLCMGRTCWNKTYEVDGTVYHLVDAVFLWKFSSYDGPMTGIAAYKGFACYAKAYTFFRHRAFWLYPLRSEEWKTELKRYADLLNGIRHDAQPIDREVYSRRKPLGFFRLFGHWKNPLECNRIRDLSHFEHHYEHFFDSPLAAAATTESKGTE